MIQNMCGKDAYGQVVLVTTGWLETPTDAEAAQFDMKEGQLKSKYWDSMLSKGARYVRHNGSTSSAEDIIRKFRDHSHVPLLSQLEMSVDGLDWADTMAAKAIAQM